MQEGGRQGRLVSNFVRSASRGPLVASRMRFDQSREKPMRNVQTGNAGVLSPRRVASAGADCSRRSFVLGSLAGMVAIPWSFASFAQTPAIPDFLSAAIANPARPEANRKVDTARKPGELLAFAGLKPGDKVLELVPGGGYFTRIFSNAVGAQGHVYALVTAEEMKAKATAADAVKAIAADAAFPHVTVLVEPISNFTVPEAVDLVWTSQNYHDFHDKSFGPADMASFNKSVFAALKPGGIFMVVDHAAAAGAGTKDTETLHRIEPAAARAEIEAAGFVLAAQSDMLRNPDDDHSKRVFDPAIRGQTDKFVFKFRKPG
jgi:predicted methyltransferase